MSSVSQTRRSGLETSTTNVTTLVQTSTHDGSWQQSGYAPALTLRQVDSDESFGHVVLKTTVLKSHDDTELKVCIGGVLNADGSARVGSTVQPEGLAPLGRVLMRQADYALYATQPSSD